MYAKVQNGVTKLGNIDSPDKQGCHGMHTNASARDAGWYGELDHRLIDQDCSGTEQFGVISDLIRKMADEGFPGPLNISWSAGKSRNPIRFALTQHLRDVGSYNRTHAQYFYEKTGNFVFRSAGNDGYEKYVSAAGADMFTVCCGAYDLGNDRVFDFSNHYTGLLVDLYANGRSPGSWRGTSFSSPRCAAAQALLQRNGLTPWEARTALLFDSVPVATNGHGDLALLNVGMAQDRTEPVVIEEAATILAAYVVGCGRRPEQAGWTWWTERARNVGTEQAIRELLTGAKNAGDWQLHKVPTARRVQAHYHLFLGREADDAGIQWWLYELAHGKYGGIKVDSESGFESAEDRDWYFIDWLAFTRAFVSAAGGERSLPDFTSLF